MIDLDKLIEAVEAGFPDWGLLEADIFDDPIKREIRGAFHGSLDAAMALHEALLPEWPVRVMDHSQEYLGAHGWHACVNWPHMDAPKGKATYPAKSYSYTAWNPNPARAWLIAVLKACRNLRKNAHSYVHQRTP